MNQPQKTREFRQGIPTPHPSPMTATPPLPAISLEKVTKVYRNDLFKKPMIAVNQLSMIFPAHACTALLGHNGAGKTTTIRMLLGLISPDEGRILFEGDRLQTEHKQFIGYMPEVNKLPLSLTCEEVLRFALLLHKNPHQTRQPWPTNSVDQLIHSKLEELGLVTQRHKKISQLSKGLARRMAFAQATIHQPRLLILDEPTSGLDPAAAHLLETLIQKEKIRGTTILLCTHELSHLVNLCDEVNILKKGQLILTSLANHGDSSLQEGGPRPVALSPRTAMAVSKTTPKDLETLKALQNLPPWDHIQVTANLRPPGDQQQVDLEFVDEAAGQRWLKSLVENGFMVTHFRRSIGFRPDEIYLYFEKDLSRSPQDVHQ